MLRGAGFLAAALLALLLQRLMPHARLRGSSVNIRLWIVNVVAVGLVCGACACTLARWAAASGIGFLNLTAAPWWLNICLTILALDSVSYSWHRANHRIPFLWRFHRVHHSDPNFTASTGLRFHSGELLLSLPVRLTAVATVGASVEAVLAFEILFTVANLLEHGDIDFPRQLERKLGRLWITPALHRRHHTKIGPDRDTNFGTIFSLWDRIFGTLRDGDSHGRVETGLAGVDGPVTLRGALLLPVSRLAS